MSDSALPSEYHPDPAARRPRVSDRLSALALQAVAGLLGLLGVDRASAFMGYFWRKLAPFGRRHTRADRHLAAARPELSVAERQVILRDMWENLGRTTAETLLLPRLIADRDRFTLDLSALEPIRDQLAKGVVFASLHQGNWELCGYGIRLAGFRVAAVYKPLSNPLADAFLHARRAPIFDAGIYPRQAATALRLRSLARGGAAIGMLADLRDTTGLKLPFFGREAYASILPVSLARRLGLPLIAGRVLRTEGAHFRIEALPIAIDRSDDVSADIQRATERLTAQYERWIADAPGQWMWAHRKWVDDIA